MMSGERVRGMELWTGRGCIPSEAYCTMGNGSQSDDYQSDYGANEVDIKVNEDDEEDRKRLHEIRLELPGPWKRGFLAESEVMEMSPLVSC